MENKIDAQKEIDAIAEDLTLVEVIRDNYDIQSFLHAWSHRFATSTSEKEDKDMKIVAEWLKKNNTIRG